MNSLIENENCSLSSRSFRVKSAIMLKNAVIPTIDTTIGAGRYPEGSRLIKNPSKTVSIRLKPTLNVKRSIPLISLFPGKSADMKA